MAIKFTNGGEILLLEYGFKSTGTDQKLKLFKNDYTPVDATVAGDFTEANFTGYTTGGKTLTRSSWTSAATNGSGKAELTYADQQWTATSSQEIFGYYITDSSDNVILAERFGASRNLTPSDTVTVAMRITADSEN